MGGFLGGFPLDNIAGPYGILSLDIGKYVLNCNPENFQEGVVHKLHLQQERSRAEKKDQKPVMIVK